MDKPANKSLNWKSCAPLLISGLLCWSGCDAMGLPGGSGGSGDSKKACDPLEGSEREVKGELDVALQGGDHAFFTLTENGVQRRLFQKSDSVWTELKIGGSALAGGKGTEEITLSFRTSDNQRAALSYEKKKDKVTWAGFAITKNDPESKDGLEEEPGLVRLEPIEDFKVPKGDKIQGLGLGKRLRFVARFAQGDATENYIVVVNADKQKAGLYVGSPERLEGARDIRIRRFKDGGTVDFEFSYKGKQGLLHLPRLPFDQEGGEDEEPKPPTLSFDQKKVKLSKVYDRQVPASAIEDFTFYGCGQAHEGKD